MDALHNPAPWQSIPHMFSENCQRFEQQVAIIDGNTQLSYNELAHRVDLCASAMRQQGVQSGESISIWAPNSWQWIVCAFACWQLGAVLVPISSRHKAMEVAPVLSRSGSRLLFTVGDCAGVDLPALLAEHSGKNSSHPFDQLPQLEHVICFDNKSAFKPCQDFGSYLADQSPHATMQNKQHNQHQQEDFAKSLCEILFTSGTTGEPKGVMLNHQQVLQAYWDWSDIGGLNSSDRFLVIPPFSHGFGVNAGILACVMRGMTHVVVDFFNADRTLELIHQHKISVISGAPALFGILAQGIAQNIGQSNEQNNFDKLSSDSLRVAYVGAAHVPEELIISMQQDLGIDRVINAYGLIEGCVVSMTRQGDPTSVISRSVGRPLPNVAVKIVDDQDTPLGNQQPGEILLRSYAVMQGYFEAATMTAATIDQDGWLRTGDIGQLDADGNLSIVGRKKEMFICNGFNVYPAEVEDLLLRNAVVSQAAVVGIANPDKGEVGVAFIQVAPQQQFDASELLSWAKQNMASYKAPQQIIAVTEFPLNANGKVRKDVLKAQAIQHKKQ